MNVSLLHSLYTRPARPTSSGYVRYTPMLYVRYTFVIFFSVNLFEEISLCMGRLWLGYAQIYPFRLPLLLTNSAL
jgi:hypothetical protein